MSRKRTLPSGPRLKVIGPGDVWPIEIDKKRDPRDWDLAPEAQGKPWDHDYYVRLKEVGRSLEADALERGLWWTAGLSRLFTYGHFAGVSATPWSQWRRAIQQACAGAFIGPSNASSACSWPRLLAEAILPAVGGIATEALADILDAHPGWGLQVALNPHLSPSVREALAKWALAGLGCDGSPTALGYVPSAYARTLNVLTRSSSGPPLCVTVAAIDMLRGRRAEAATSWAVQTLIASRSTSRETLLWLLNECSADVESWLGLLVAHQAWQENDAAFLAQVILSRVHREHTAREGCKMESFYLLEATISRSVLLELSRRLGDFPKNSQGAWLLVLSQHRKAGRRVWLALLDVTSENLDLQRHLLEIIAASRAAWSNERLAQAMRAAKCPGIAVFGLQWDTPEHWPEHVLLAREDALFDMVVQYRARKGGPSEAMEEILPYLLQVQDRDLRIRLLFPRIRQTTR